MGRQRSSRTTGATARRVGHLTGSGSRSSTAGLYTIDAGGAGRTLVTRSVPCPASLAGPLAASRLSHTALAAPDRTIIYGTDAGFTATVSANGATPTGQVQFRVNAKTMAKRSL